MARRNAAVDLDFAFFTELWRFYNDRRGVIRKHYRALTKKFLDHNNPENVGTFLRQPQYEALEMYVFLKEFLDNAPVHEIFRDWAAMQGKFEGRQRLDLFEQQDQYEPIFKRMKANRRSYSNYIFALTMGTGKTILMATCIFYEFILANKFPKDPKYVHNALVFAPDTTVLQSLKEIQTFNMSKVVPPEYLNFLSTHIQFHFLDESGIALSTMDKSRFNLIISNTQKIILKRKQAEKTPTEQLFKEDKSEYQSIYNQVYADLGIFDEPDDDASLMSNQRFEKLRRLEQLGIYIDEAHHAFGTKLAKDMGHKKASSLRVTVDELAASLKKSGTRVVACYNYTGTPYVGKDILPEVVYAYGLQDAINNEYLKKVVVNGYTNPKSHQFVELAVDDFLAQTAGLRPEGMLPKLAFFAPTIDELQKGLRPAVERALAKHGISTDTILINVGDERITKDDDIREFNQLDTTRSEKQFILLVNKALEGWNCRSLFGVALYRKPKSKILVLQATMRCLRAIGETQPTGHVYLSDENKQILEKELQQNFRVSVDDMMKAGTEKKAYQVRVSPPPVKLTLKRVKKLYRAQEKDITEGASLELDKADTEKYRLIHTQQEGLSVSDASRNRVTERDITEIKEKRIFSKLSLVAEIARYLNKSPLEVEKILAATQEGVGGILEYVNQFNELLYDWVVPALFNELYDIREYTDEEAYEVELVKAPKDKDYYQVTALEELTVLEDQVTPEEADKSFHLDTYCFDSRPEHILFFDLLRDERVKSLYFTGMLTHGQSDFYIQYIDPESHTIRSYYPDFLFQKEDGQYVIVEVKGDNKIEDPIVLAKKQFAEQMADASGMSYQIIKGSEAQKSRYHRLLVPVEESQELFDTK